MKKFMFLFVMIIITSCIDIGGMGGSNTPQYANVQEIVVWGLSENNDANITIGYTGAGGIWTGQSLRYTEDTEETFFDEIDVYYVSIDPYSNSPSYMISSVFFNHVLTIYVQKIGN